MERSQENYEVGGFSFQTQEEAELAKKEQEGVRFIKQKMDMENPEMVLQVYHSMIRQNLFETPIGYCFLNEIREYLLVIPAIQNSDVEQIPVKHSRQGAERRNKKENTPKEKTAKEKKKDKKEQRGKNTDYKARCYFFMLTTLILAISVATMMLLAATSDNINILNYENKLIDKYSSWEEELEEREQELKKME